MPKAVLQQRQSAGTPSGEPPQTCHTCRRKRLKCDGAVPACQKCARAGRECLGYGKLIIWNRGVASRGKMMGKTFPSAPSTPTNGTLSLSTLLDPLFKDLDKQSRFYVHHFADVICRDVVVYDTPDRNPIRRLIPLLREHPMIRHIIVASGAHHMFNTGQATITSPISAEHSGRMTPGDHYQQALLAKQQGLQLLISALNDPQLADSDVILACVLLFINYELIESGQNTATVHLRAARKLMVHLSSCGDSSRASQVVPAMSNLRQYLLSDCLV